MARSLNFSWTISTIKIMVKTKLSKAVRITEKTETQEQQRLGEYPQKKAKPET